MAKLTETQVQEIREHMIDATSGNDASKRLEKKYKAYSKAYLIEKIDKNEIEDRLEDGWELVGTPTARKATVQKRKVAGLLFEHEIWCMFKELGFNILNNDENLVVQWGDNKGDTHQLDVVAVGKEAIFVVECKAAEKQKPGIFKKDINEMLLYKNGVTQALRQIYGQEKRVKFLFATKNYTFSKESEDIKRLKDNDIYHFNENSYSYVKSLIKSYKDAVIYQFYGLMFKGKIINNDPYRIPALKGSMGGHDYYMLSMKPSLLLKIGFVLHRTKVNDSMAPTYQRLLVPKRLKGITSFIDNGGYFPNSIIINFDGSNKKSQVRFERSGGSEDAQFGSLIIPNTYGIAYIIDGQHRVYGYAGSEYKDKNTIPVVAFVNMDSQEQLQIFMDINENQKAVSPSLRLDLAEDLNWDSDRADSRMLALRSSIIKVMASDSNNVLYNKISVGEDVAPLKFKPFETALSKSGLLPKAQSKKFVADKECCLYDFSLFDKSEAMRQSRRMVSDFILECYAYAKQNIDEVNYNAFIQSNIGTYAFIVLLGELNRYLIAEKTLPQLASLKDRMAVIKPYLNILCNYLKDLPEADRSTMKLIKGQGADTEWLHHFENAIHKQENGFCPSELALWLEKQDDNLQADGRQLGEEIEELLKQKVFSKLKELLGEKWESNIAIANIKVACQQALIKRDGEEAELDNWQEMIQMSDLKDIITSNLWILRNDAVEGYVTFEEEFSIKLNNDDPFKSKKDKTKWLDELKSMSGAWTGKKEKKLSQAQVNTLRIIYSYFETDVEESL